MTKKTVMSFLTGFVSAIVIFFFAVIIGNEIIFCKYDDSDPEPEIEATALDTVKLLVVESGDTAAFRKLLREYQTRKDFNFYPYARIMADRYGYEPACYYVYSSLMDGGDTLDAHQRGIADEYLRRAVENGDTAAMSELQRKKKSNK